MKIKLSHHLSSQGFTLIEILLTMAVATTLLGFMTMNLLHAQNSATLSSVVESLDSDLKSQQNKAMSGESTVSSSGESYGVAIAAHQYTLYHGTTYDPGDSKNFTIAVDNPITLSSSPSTQVLFAQRSGEISSAPFTITITNTITNEHKTLTLNRYGVIVSIN